MRMLNPELLSRAGIAKNVSETASGGMAFTFAALAYLIALIAVAFCIFFAIYTVICIDELKTDYKNPIEQCNNLNQLILPEYAIHLVFTLLFVFSAQIIATFMNLPLSIYHIATYMRRPVMSGPGIYDPTTILNRNELSSALKASWVKLAFYLISFFYYLYATLVLNVMSIKSCYRDLINVFQIV
uniref:Protein cornichon n=1 Tax=Heterorhabditis bacteriophora TaxID=37862 RepID=A0A1I7X0W3_HETBA